MSDEDDDDDDDDDNLIEPSRSILVRTSIELFDAKLVRQLARQPSELHRLNDRQFELFVGELLRDMGAEVEVTQQSRDGGVDILAAFTTPIGKLLTVVECKKYSPHRAVGVAYVERFLFTLRERRRANVGLMATTSRFSSGGIKCQRDFPWQLQLAEFDRISEWLSQYGKWAKQPKSQIWLPNIEV